MNRFQRALASRRLGTVVGLAVLAGWASAAPAEPVLRGSRVLLRDRDHRGDLPPEERFAVAWQLADTLAMRQALQDEAFPPHLAHWARARWQWRDQSPRQALEEFQESARLWPRDARRESHDVRLIFDRQRIECAVQAGRADLARAFLGDLRADARDPVIEAWVVWLDHQDARLPVADAVAAMDRAWSRAARAERRNAAFLRRPLLHLAAGDSAGAARAWLDCLDRARRPGPRRRALEFWDTHPELRGLVDQPDFAPGCARWLARNLRRPEAVELLEARLAVDPGDDESFVAAAEQFYRLRQDDALQSWLGREWPDSLDREERAELEGLGLGAKRRAGASIELARSYEDLARRYPETRRAVEALWESAWMFEIEEEFAAAQRLYDEYVVRAPRARYGRDAAVRGLLMRYRRGADSSELLARFEEVAPMLGDDAARGSALWLLYHRAQAQNDTQLQTRLGTELESMESPVPLWQSPRVDRFSKVRSASSLLKLQADAFARVRVGLGDEWEMDPHVEEARELLRLGLTEEGESELLALVRDRSSETRLLFDSAMVAWEMGSPEVQARVAFLLRRRLSNDDPVSNRDLWTIARPTPFYDAVLAASREFDVSPHLLWAVMRRESFYDPDVVSIAGAHGLVQIMPATAAEIVDRAAWPGDWVGGLLQPATNLRFGAFHLRERLEDYGASPFLALAAYNAGPVMARRWSQRMPEGETPPFLALLISYTETRGYVYDVLRNAAVYASLAGLE